MSACKITRPLPTSFKMLKMYAYIKVYIQAYVIEGSGGSKSNVGGKYAYNAVQCGARAKDKAQAMHGKKGEVYKMDDSFIAR